MKHDVRMRGFAERVDVEVVDAFLAKHARHCSRGIGPAPRMCRPRARGGCRGRVDVPGFPRSAMDGYAVRGEETFGASAYDAIRLKVAGVSLPGNPFRGGSSAVRRSGS